MDPRLKGSGTERDKGILRTPVGSTPRHSAPALRSHPSSHKPSETSSRAVFTKDNVKAHYYVGTHAEEIYTNRPRFFFCNMPSESMQIVISDNQIQWGNFVRTTRGS